MHPLDVKISLSNEINVIRIECVKQKKSIFQFVSPVVFSWPPHNSAAQSSLPLALGSSQLSPPSASTLRWKRGAVIWRAGALLNSFSAPVPTTVSSQGVTYCPKWTRGTQLVSEDACTLSLYMWVSLFLL